MAKTVKRSYYSKKLGKVVTKTYTYDKPAKRKVSKEYKGTLIYKNGKINKKLLEQLKKTMSSDKYADLDEAVTSYYFNEKYKDKRLTVQSAKAYAASNKIESFIINTGYTVDELVNEINAKYSANIDVEYILNAEHWNNGNLILPSGQQVEFQFRYEGSILV